MTGCAPRRTSGRRWSTRRRSPRSSGEESRSRRSSSTACSPPTPTGRSTRPSSTSPSTPRRRGHRRRRCSPDRTRRRRRPVRCLERERTLDGLPVTFCLTHDSSSAMAPLSPPAHLPLAEYFSASDGGVGRKEGSLAAALYMMSMIRVYKEEGFKNQQAIAAAPTLTGPVPHALTGPAAFPRGGTDHYAARSPLMGPARFLGPDSPSGPRKCDGNRRVTWGGDGIWAPRLFFAAESSPSNCLDGTLVRSAGSTDSF